MLKPTLVYLLDDICTLTYRDVYSNKPSSSNDDLNSLQEELSDGEFAYVFTKKETGTTIHYQHREYSITIYDWEDTMEIMMGPHVFTFNIKDIYGVSIMVSEMDKAKRSYLLLENQPSSKTPYICKLRLGMIKSKVVFEP